MRIVFLCGSLEIGKDGVSDYIRCLSTELIKQGNAVSAVALNDRFITEKIVETQNNDYISFSVLRIPSKTSASRKSLWAKKWVEEFAPNWVSLQFVPYAYNIKGLPFGLAKLLSSLSGPFKWHIMFHELWIEERRPLSTMIVSHLQQLIIRHCVHKLKPSLVHVSIPFNKQRLSRIGVQAAVLRLFGNILKRSPNALPVPFNNLPPTTKKILYFGTAPRGEFLEQVVSELVNFCIKVPSPISIVLVCGYTPMKDAFVQKLTETLSGYGILIVDCGFVESDVLSSLLTECTVGIARSEIRYLGKSGSAIAMLEHGLPIWVPKWKSEHALDYDFRDRLIFRDLISAIKCTERPEYFSLLPEVAQQFINHINHNFNDTARFYPTLSTRSSDGFHYSSQNTTISST
ncbi:hypothetical protein PKOR_13815 [Pontibacter korlensis]|uniref:Glycosyltransferase subfamily 4-like N-terminal domain-containing protein n=1 Tax=Pontibacter korlensis TaxID=400092 RepID=A0A0E3ZEY5_9BACT|nr:glycosyltransferase [Pontibacter korlensis]AKD03979.1 hypothetical protein PKOR_13815 [Pontibacter korlensis]